MFDTSRPIPAINKMGIVCELTMMITVEVRRLSYRGLRFRCWERGRFLK
jgi:hypothetical protein